MQGGIINMRDVTYSTETLNNVDYLVARVGMETEIVEFQIRMLTYANLEGLISVSKRQINDNVAFYYDITSKKTLAQIISERKVSRPDFLNMLNELISTFKQLDEYHLVGSGVLLDKEYIYISDADFSPSFIYLPIEKSGDGIENIKHFVFDLILSSKIESTSDNFIQVILDALNLNSFSLHALERIINEQRDEKQSDILNPNLYEHLIHESIDSQLNVAGKSQSAFGDQADCKSVPKPELLKEQEHPVRYESEQANVNLEKHTFLQKKRTTIFVGAHVIAAALLITYIASGAFVVDGQLQVLMIAAFLFLIVTAELIVFHVIYPNASSPLSLRRSMPISSKQQDELLSPHKQHDELSSPHKQRDELSSPHKQRDELLSPHKQQDELSLPRKQQDELSLPRKQQDELSLPHKQQDELLSPHKQQDELLSPPKEQQQTGAPQERPNTQLTSLDVDVIKAILDEDSAKTSLDEDIIRALEGEETVLMDMPGQGYLKGIDNTCNYLLNKPIAIIGRSQKKADCVLTSERVGRKHAVIIHNGKLSEYSILDRDSLNGTFVNNKRISSYQLYPLKDGDMIRFADSEFIIIVPHRETERNLRVSDGSSLYSQI